MSKEELKEKYGIEIWDDETKKDFQKTLLDWYDSEKRDLPWRKTKDPYKIWVSEIMLQQTRVDTVIPYYNRFLSELPDVKSLANAPEDQLLKLWEGLGYYSRVRNMKTAAQQIMIHFDGKFPSDPSDIQSLKGIGPYTAGAIGSIAFGHPTPAVDGNLMRVMARLFEIDLDMKSAKNRKIFEAVGREIIDADRPGDFNQALMDLGATIVTPKNYNPELSPVKDFDRSYLNKTWDKYPVASKAKKSVDKHYFAFIIKDQEGNYLLEKRPQKGLLANLWTFPLIEDEEVELGKKKIPQTLNQDLQVNVKNILADKYQISTEINPNNLGNVKHIFSHQNWYLFLFEVDAKDGVDSIPDHCQWVSEDKFDELAFPKLQQKIIDQYYQPTLFKSN